jgi:aspartate kinase
VGPANIEMISQGASTINVTFIVQEGDAPDAVRRLHAEFFPA